MNNRSTLKMLNQFSNEVQRYFSPPMAVMRLPYGKRMVESKKLVPPPAFDTPEFAKLSEAFQKYLHEKYLKTIILDQTLRRTMPLSFDFDMYREALKECGNHPLVKTDSRDSSRSLFRADQFDGLVSYTAKRNFYDLEKESKLSKIIADNAPTDFYHSRKKR